MKKRIIIGISILIGITLIISTFILKKKDNNYQSYNNLGSHLAFYYQDDNGDYVPSTDVKWIEGNYTLNISESVCNGTKNPSYLSWNENDRTVILSNGVSTSCTLYFDKNKTTLDVLLETPVGDQGEFLKHTPELPNSAKDGGYRYSGNQPNNYICFGSGSEEYNNGTPGATCDVKNKYRIIGVVPVTVGEETKNLVKVIKAEYLTEDEFGTKAGTASVSSSYAGIKRIESPQSGIPGYKWNTLINNWSKSTLYTSLNSSDYIDKAFGENWKGKIETVKWNVGGVGSSYTSYNAQKMYEEEMNNQGKTTIIDAQIGLMYAHDYGFASSSDNWQTELNNYYKNENLNNNWLFNGVFEWTISRESSDSHNAYLVGYSGYVNSGDVRDTGVAVRPVFYLKSNVQLVSDASAKGTKEKPLKVDPPAQGSTNNLN